MNESPQDETQSFSEYVTLVKKLEKAVQDTPSREEKKDKEEEEEEKKPIEEEIEGSKQEHENTLKEVEIQTKIIEQVSLSELKKGEIEAKKADNMLIIEKELFEAFSGTKIQLADFYYEIEDLADSEIERIIKTKMQSLTDIKIKEKTSLGYPFALCKIDSKYKILVPVDTGEIELPTFLSGTKKQLKLLNCGDKNQLNLSQKDLETWDHTLNQFQLKFTQFLNKDIKEKLRKNQPKDIQLVNIDSVSIQDFINNFEKNAKILNSYYNEIINYYEKLEDKINKKIGFWSEKEEFARALELLKEQLSKIHEKHTALSKDAQIEYFKLRRAQRQLDGKTTRYKIDEKRGKKITREEKEELIKRVREFQKKKEEISEDIKETKEIEQILLQWSDILEISDLNEANETVLDYFGNTIKKSLEELLKEKEFEKIAGKIKDIETILEDISIHVIYVPTAIYSFVAQQGEQKIEGKLLYLALTEDSVFLK